MIMCLAMLLYFPSGMFSTCFGLKASAEEITLTEPSPDGSGVYQIETAGELYWFADCVNSGETSANAVLINESLKNLTESMSNYGSAAEAYFGNGTVAEQTVTDDLSGYAFTVGTMPEEGISYYGSSLILDSETTIRHYFKLADVTNIDDFDFTVGDILVTPVEKQGYYYIDIKNVSAEKLGISFDVSINGAEVITNYSALSYANKVLGSDSADDNLKNLVKALISTTRMHLHIKIQMQMKHKQEAVIMKETYIAPEMEITEFECEDVITTSGIFPDDNELPIV